MLDEKQLQGLLLATAKRDKAAFTSLYNLTSAHLYAVAMRIVKKPTLADDVLQDAFISIWNKASAFSINKGSVMAWMSSIVRYRALDVIRRQKNNVDYQEVEGEMQDLDNIDMTMMQSDMAMALRECIDLLDAEQKQSMLLAFYEGLTHGELAVRLAKPLGTVKSWLRRSLVQVKTCLEA